MVSKVMKPATFAAENFTEEEAKAKIGKAVRLLTDHHHLSKGEVGYVVDFHEVANDDYELVVRWDLPNNMEPFHDRFTRKQYSRLFTEEE